MGTERISDRIIQDALDYRALVEARADSEARMYLAGRANNNPMTREHKDLIEGVLAPEYAGRTVLELLQNGHDAHSAARSDGELEVLLDGTEGEHGTLYVANRGTSITEQNFARMCGTGLSPKRPDEGIGNKGIGIKSVLQLSTAPEVYSSRAEGLSDLDGYRFRFATPEDFDTIAARIGPDEPGLADELRANVAGLRAPVPLDGLPAAVAAYAARRFATVVRLPLRSAAARDDALVQIQEITSSDAPFNLFLQRVSTITFTTIDDVGGPNTSVLRRSSTSPRWAAGLRRRGIVVSRLRLGDGSQYLLASADVPESEFLKAIHQSCDAGELNEAWREWNGPALVAVALPMDRALESGRLYTFLPMGAEAKSPLPAFVNAPFASRADRRSLVETMPVNALLLDSLARLCARMLIAGANGDASIPDETLVDLATWDERLLGHLEAALENEGADLWGLPFLSRIGGARRRTSLPSALLWQLTGKVLKPRLVAQVSEHHFIDPGLDATRLRHLRALLSARGLSLDPAGEVLADCAEAVALHLAEDLAPPRRWANFYDDLATLDVPPEALRGRRIVRDEDGDLVGVGGDGSEAPVLYFSPQQTEDAELGVAIPPALTTRFRFASPDVPTRRAGLGRALLPGREWLERAGLIREYRTENILQAVGTAMKAILATAEPSDEDLRSCLTFAFSLTRSATRGVSDEVLSSAGLLVPTAHGWCAAHEATFGSGWGGPRSHIDDRLVRLLSSLAEHSDQLHSVQAQLLLSPTMIAGPAEPEMITLWRSFLESLGARHGLWPIELPRRRLALRGDALARPKRTTLSTLALDAATKAMWISCAESWPGREPLYDGVQYTARRGVMVLPGQDRFEHWSEPQQQWFAELIVTGLEVWPDSALEMRFTRRQSDPSGAVWPTPVTAFLAHASWVPQSRPGDRNAVDLRQAEEAWWLREAETPDFMPAQPAALRSATSDRVVARLRRVGVKQWDSPDSALARLDFLAARLASGHLDPTGRSATIVGRATEAAWANLIDGEGLVEVPGRLVVWSAGRLTTTAGASDTHPAVYVVDTEGTRQERLIASSPLSLLPVRDGRLGARVLAALRSGGYEGVGVSEVRLQARIDGAPVEAAESVPLVAPPWEWLPDLLIAVADLRTRTVGRLSAASLRAAVDRVARARLVVGNRIEVAVDDHELTDTGPTSMIVPTEDGELVVVGGVGTDDRWAVLEAMTDSLAIMISAPQLVDTLRLAVRDLCRLPPAQVDAPAIGAAIRVTPAEVRAALDLVRDLGVDVRPYVRVLMCLDPAVGLALFEAREDVRNRDFLARWLEEHVRPGHVGATDVLRLAEQGRSEVVMDETRVPIHAVNQGLRAVGMEPMRNSDGQQRAFRAFLQAQAPQIRTELRDRFYETELEPGDLSVYVRLRDRVEQIEVDPGWVEEYWTVPPTVMRRRITAWLDEHAPSRGAAASGLPDAEATRAHSQKSVRSVLSRLPVVIEAWLHRNDAERAHRELDPALVVTEFTSSGRLDFGSPTPEEVLQGLQEARMWPPRMPLTTTLAALGLGRADLDVARERLHARAVELQAARESVNFGGADFSAGDDELIRLYEAVRSAPLDGFLETDPDPASLPYLELGGRAGGIGGPSKSGGAVGNPSPVKTKNVGLIGEVLVSRWIEHHFGQEPTETWKSGYRGLVLADGKGSDSLGYDFRVETDEKTLLFEVKASLAADGQFQLGESEVRRAQNLAPDEDYRIIFVADAADPATARLIPLPNPFAPGGLQRYRVVGRALRLRFAMDG